MQERTVSLPEDALKLSEVEDLWSKTGSQHDYGNFCCRLITLPEKTNSHFKPPKNGWMVGIRSPFLLGLGLFSGAKMLLVLVSVRVPQAA